MHGDNDPDAFVVTVYDVIISITLCIICFRNAAPAFHKHYFKFERMFAPVKNFSELICSLLHVFYFRRKSNYINSISVNKIQMTVFT